MTAYVEPFATWADMTHLVPRERWPEDSTPRNIAYFCGPLREEEKIPPFGNHPEFPAQQEERVLDMAHSWFDEFATSVLPGAEAPGPHDNLDFDLLVDPKSGAGRERLKAQYFRANVNPSDRYVVSLPGTTEFRPRADESGFGNLFIAGDWLR